MCFFPLHFYYFFMQHFFRFMPPVCYRTAWYVFVFLLAIGTTYAPSLSAQVPPGSSPRLDIDWLYSGATDRMTQVPRLQWRSDGTAYLWDSRLSANERTIEQYNPATNTRKPLVNGQNALATLRQIMGNDAPSTLSQPDAYSPNDTLALYKINDDIFVLDMTTSAFQRITSTPNAEEDNISFSPDGKTIVYARNKNLYAFSLNTNKEFALTTDGSATTLNGTLSWVYWEEVFNRDDKNYWWSKDSKTIAYFQSDESAVDIVYYPDHRTFTQRAITQRYPKIGRPNPKVKLGLLDIPTQTTQWIDLSAFDHEYVVRVTWLPDNKRIAVQLMNRAQDSLTLVFVDRTTLKPEFIFKEGDPGWINPHDDLKFLSNGEEFLWVSERTGYAHIYRYDMTGKLLNPVTQGKWALDKNHAIMGMDKQFVYFIAKEKSSRERHLYRAGFDGKSFERITKDDGVHAVSMSPDTKYFSATYSNIATPPIVYVASTDAKQRGKRIVTYKSADTTAIERFGIRTPELFTITTADGYAMPAQILKPKNFDSTKKYPVILFVYGGPSAPQVLHQWQRDVLLHNVFLQEGYLVAKVDNRSAAAMGKVYENLVCKNLGGEIETNDHVAGARWLKQQSYVDSTRIGIWGWSFGGTSVLNALTRSKEFKAGIAGAGVTDWRFYDTFYAEGMMKSPASNREGYEKTSLLPRAKDLHGNLLILHGTYDDNVHPQNTWAFIDELIKAGKQYELQIYPMRKHGFTDRPARIHHHRVMLDFWKRKL